VAAVGFAAASGDGLMNVNDHRRHLI
jgi:hypothetical protein